RALVHATGSPRLARVRRATGSRPLCTLLGSPERFVRVAVPAYLVGGGESGKEVRVHFVARNGGEAYRNGNDTQIAD
ncbi:MAG: hypothetical protein JWM19_2134, partial [Actinomycetia bacterium]|nr:hypothetical protein [Actinomycetes bacterium]